MHAYDYVVESCKMVQGWNERNGHKFKNNCEDAMKGNYRPEINISDELGDNLATQFQQTIGILRWSVGLGRINSIAELLFLSSFNISPCREHLEAAYRIFEYLYSHQRGGCVVFDDTKPKMNEE